MIYQEVTAMKSIPYRYVICACGTALIFISVGLLSNAFPIYFPFIMEIRAFNHYAQLNRPFFHVCRGPVL